MTLPNCKTIAHFRLSEIWAGFFNVYRCIFSPYTTHSCYCISWCIWTLYSIVILFHLLVFASRLACVTGLDCEIWASFALASSLPIAALFEMKFSTIFFAVVCVRVNVFIERVRLSLFECVIVHCLCWIAHLRTTWVLNVQGRQPVSAWAVNINVTKRIERFDCCLCKVLVLQHHTDSFDWQVFWCVDASISFYFTRSQKHRRHQKHKSSGIDFYFLSLLNERQTQNDALHWCVVCIYTFLAFLPQPFLVVKVFFFLRSFTWSFYLSVFKFNF